MRKKNKRNKKIQSIVRTSNNDVIKSTNMIQPQLTISEEIDRDINSFRKMKERENQSYSFKKNYLRNHLKKIKGITFLSEICGIIGLVFSIATFFYAQQISEKQSTIEKAARIQEVNSIIDNGLMSKLILIQESDKYRNSKYRNILESIINCEYLFHQNILAHNFLLNDENNVDNEKEANILISVLINHISQQKPLSNKTIQIRNLIINSDLCKDEKFVTNIYSHFRAILPKQKCVLNTSNVFIIKLKKISEDKKHNKIDIINAANIIAKEIKSSNFFENQISLYRYSNELFDYAISYILNKPTE